MGLIFLPSSGRAASDNFTTFLIKNRRVFYRGRRFQTAKRGRAFTIIIENFIPQVNTHGRPADH